MRRTRIRLRYDHRTEDSTELLIVESNITIDMLVEDGQDSVTDFEDMSGRTSFETILSSVSATRIAFDIEKLPAIMRDGILERRGRSRMTCDTTIAHDMDHIITADPISGTPRNVRPAVQPVFGFDGLQITPPLGSAMWSRKMDARAGISPPLTHPGKWC